MILQRLRVLQSTRLLPDTFKLFRPNKQFESYNLKYFSQKTLNLREIANGSVLWQKNTFRPSSTCSLNGKPMLESNPRWTTIPAGAVFNCQVGDFLFRIQKRHFTEDKETTALTVWSNLKELKSSPVPALVYGFSGLIPFVSVPVYMTMSQLYLPQLTFAQLTYGAIILSFLGGVRWGFVIPEESTHKPNWFNLGYSVTPSLLAWVGLLLPDPISLFCVMAGLVGAAYFDTAIPGYPPWFKGLRFVLSIVAVLSLWTTFMCRFFLSSVKENFVDQPKKD